MAETTIHTICVRENQSGQFEYTFKAEEGYIFTDVPQVYLITGEEWDTTNNGPMSITYGTDFRETYGDGTGIHGTESVTVTLSYNIPDLNPTDDNTNKIYINFFTTKIMASCLPTSDYIVFTGSGGSPRINGITPFTTYVGQNNYFGSYGGGVVFLHAGMYQTTYDYYIDAEADAFTLYSQNPGISVSGSLSKTISVSTSLYTGNIDVYWGNVAITITADFDRATMIFADGYRSTYEWIRYQESCAPNYTVRSIGLGTTKATVAKVDNCEYWGTIPVEWSPTYKTQEGQTVLMSTSNGYSFSKVEQHRPIDDNSSTTSALEPYGQLYTRDSTWISVYSEIDDSRVRISFDSGNTWQFVNDSAFPTYINTQFLWTDLTYAGYDQTIENHIWYALAYAGGSYDLFYILKSVDDGLTWTDVVFDGANHYTAFTNTSHIENGNINVNRGRLWVNLEKDYIFVFLPRAVDKVTGAEQWVLYRGFPSSEGAGNGGEMRAVIAADETYGAPPTYQGKDFLWDGVIFVTDNINEQLPLSVNDDNGLCIFTTEDNYVVSWNYGLNWSQTTLPVVNQTHSVTGASYIYPEKDPTPVYFEGKNLVITSHTDDVNYNQNNVMANNRLLNGVMEINIDNAEGWITGVVPTGWGDVQTFGVPSGLTSQAVGPYAYNYGSEATIYGNNILFHNSRYNLTLDPNFTSYYWYSWNITTGITVATGDTTTQTPPGLSPLLVKGYGNNLFAKGDQNGPVSNVDEDWVLFKSTDNGQTWNASYTHANVNAYLFHFSWDENGNDPFMFMRSSQAPRLLYSLDSGNTWNSSANESQYTFYISNPKHVYSDGYLWIIDGAPNEKSWILPANSSVMSDVLNWSTYEVQTLLPANSTNNSCRQIAVFGQKAIMQYGNFEYYYTIDRGQTWTNLTTLTTTDGVTYTNSDFINWNYGLDVHKDTGEFILQIGSSQEYIVTTDFTTWEALKYDPSDPTGDNDASYSVQNKIDGSDGNWYLLVRGGLNNGYYANPRLFNLSSAATTSPPTVDRIVSSWSVLNEYTYTDVDPTTNPDYLRDGYYGIPIYNIYKDYNQPDGKPRMFITRPWAIDVIPEPLAPTVINGSSVQQISYPGFTDVATLQYDVAPGYIRQYEVYSDDPFGIVYVKYTGETVKLDGVFNITVYSICQPEVIPSTAGQTITYGTEQDVLYSAAAHGWGFDFFWLSGPPTAEDGIVLTVQRNQVKIIQERDDVPTRENATTIEDLVTYVTDYAIPIPTSYTWNNVYIQENNPPDYGGRMIFFPPRNDKRVNVVGMKLYADVYGTPFLDGYYTAENWVDFFGSEDPDQFWGDIENTDYMLVENGIVVEVGHSKNLPDYDQC